MLGISQTKKTQEENVNEAFAVIGVQSSARHAA
jgi:hypothetical protein